MQKSYNEIQNEAIKIFKLEGKNPRTWSPADVQAVDSYVSRQISKQGMGGIDPRVAALYRNAGLDAMGRHQALQKLGAEQGASDAINNMWGDFGGGGELGAYNPDYDPYVDDYTKDREDEREQIRDQNEQEKPEKEDDTQEPQEPTEDNGESPEPKIGEDGSAPKPKIPDETAPTTEGVASKTVPGLGQAGNTAKVAGGTAEGAGTVAGATGVTAGAGAEAAVVAAEAGAAAPEFLLVVIVLGVIFLVLIVLWGIFAQNPGSLNDTAVAETAAGTGQPANTQVKGKGWSLIDGKDYSGVICAVGSEDVGTYTHPTRTFTIRKCKTQIGIVASVNSQNIVNMIAAAKLDGITLGGSTLRTYERQQELYDENCSSSGCNPPTAKPGNSMHERGLATDFTQNGNILSKVHTSYSWLVKNAAKYGYYNFSPEPWHWSTSGG